MCIWIGINYICNMIQLAVAIFAQVHLEDAPTSDTHASAMAALFKIEVNDPSSTAMFRRPPFIPWGFWMPEHQANACAWWYERVFRDSYRGRKGTAKYHRIYEPMTFLIVTMYYPALKSDELPPLPKVIIAHDANRGRKARTRVKHFCVARMLGCACPHHGTCEVIISHKKAANLTRRDLTEHMARATDQHI